MPSSRKKAVQYVPMTPGGTLCMHLVAPTEARAWEMLMEDASHMPYGTVQAFKLRGYTVVTIEPAPTRYEAMEGLLEELRSARALLLYGDKWIERIDEVLAMPKDRA